MESLLNAEGKPQIPNSEDLTFEGLRVLPKQDILLKLISSLHQHSQVHNRILSTCNDEFKLRPTYSELTQFLAIQKKDLSFDPSKLYISVSALDHISAELSSKIETTSQYYSKKFAAIADDFDDSKHTLMDKLRQTHQKTTEAVSVADRSLNLACNMAKRQLQSFKLKQVFGQWKQLSESKKRATAALCSMLRTREHAAYKSRWTYWRNLDLHCRLKKQEGAAVKALLRAQEAASAMIRVTEEYCLYRIAELQRTKAERATVERLERATDSSSVKEVMKDIQFMIQQEVGTLQQKIDASSSQFDYQLFELKKELAATTKSASVEDFSTQMAQFKSALIQLKHAHTLTAEKLARIDFTNQQENTQFELTCLQHEVSSLKAQVTRDQPAETTNLSPLRAFFQLSRPVTASTRMGGPQKSQVFDNLSTTANLRRESTALEVVGTSSNRNKRINSANVRKRRGALRNSRAPHCVLSTSVLELSQDKTD